MYVAYWFSNLSPAYRYLPYARGYIICRNFNPCRGVDYASVWIVPNTLNPNA